MRILIDHRTLELVQGDITTLEADAIVNAADSRLTGRAGVDDAIHSAAGKSVTAECKKIGECATGSAVATGAGKLKAKHIFHAVGPEWDGGSSGEEDMLEKTYLACLDLAKQHACKSIAFPAISTGACAFPIATAAEVALITLGGHLGADTGLQKISYVLFDRTAYSDTKKVARKLAEENGWQVSVHE